MRLHIGAPDPPPRPRLAWAIAIALVMGVSLPIGSIASAAEPPSPLRLVDMDGETHDVDALLSGGKHVVLVFWQTWCGSCRSEAPELAEAVKEHGDAIAFFGVIAGPDRSVDDEKVRETAKDWGLSHPQIRDRDLALAKTYDAFGTPVIVVLGPDRKVLYRGYRLPSSWDAYLGAESRPLLPAKAS